MKRIVLIVLAAIAVSCNNDFVENESLVSNNVTKIVLNNNNDEVILEFSKLIGLTLKDKNVRGEVINLVNDIDPKGNGVSFALLYGDLDNITKYEKKILNDKKYLNKINKDNLFKSKLNQVYEETEHPNLDYYLSKIVDSKHQHKSIDTAIDTFVSENNLELYFPYQERFDWSNVNEFTVTVEEFGLQDDYLEDDDYDLYYSGLKFMDISVISIDIINDDYLFENPTIAIVEKDDDYLGNFTRLSIGENEYLIDRGLSNEQIISEYNNIWQSEFPEFINEMPGGGSASNSSSGTDWGPAPQRVRIPQNINPYTFFPENYVLTTFIPRARIKGTSWKRYLSKSHRTRLQRVGGDVTVNPSGGFAFGPKVYNYDFDISASDLRNDRWQNLGIMFDPNWHKTKGSQQIVLWTKRKNSSRKDVTVKNEVKIDAQGNFTPTASQQVNIKAHSGVKAIFRGNIELDRDQVLTTIVNGSEFDNAVFNYDNLNLSVRRISHRFEFVFDHYYTDLSN